MALEMRKYCENCSQPLQDQGVAFLFALMNVHSVQTVLKKWSRSAQIVGENL
ncbi:hypothetical protein DFR59_102115 [Falsibacillus pallidus]|uniref:Uncharacterized protein n=1 Tax=Falsibacillus pallidus TaxID=493781 RepID=A0A370GP88_9BACI|nr:hypothetical protein DFR59_102115 [Falsibacillus pallidus]